ncbi:MAG: TetR/AcrR family transcriptional regulator [Pseudomonadota bacterium]
MTPRPPRLPPDEQRDAIIDAARKLLAEQGHDRLRVVSVANELGMSHANVYRFFPSREALMDAIVESWLAYSRAEVKEIATRSEPPLNRLRAIVLSMHRNAKRRFREEPNVSELYEHLHGRRAESARQHIALLYGLGRELLREAAETGELAVKDLDAALRLVHAATAKFTTPRLIRESLDEDTMTQLSQVLDALLLAFRTDPELLERSHPDAR